MFRSALRGDGLIPWRDWLAVTLLAWLAPPILGVALLLTHLVLIAAAGLFGATLPESVAGFFAFSLIAVFAPILSWIGFLVALPIILLVLRQGWGGWGSFVLGGLTVGALIAFLIGGGSELVVVPIGVLSALTWRWAMGRLRPEFFLRDPENRP